MKYLLDTNLCIHIIRKKPPALIQKVASYELGEIGLSTVTIAELQHGVEKSNQVEQNQQALTQFLLPFVVVDFDYDAAVVYGRVRVVLERAGTPIGAFDLLLAAQALALHVIFVTNNTKEFARVPTLQIEDWTTI
jgi:tRNA(fMet)-specific endonuclease VapC